MPVWFERSMASEARSLRLCLSMFQYIVYIVVSGSARWQCGLKGKWQGKPDLSDCVSPCFSILYTLLFQAQLDGNVVWEVNGEGSQISQIVSLHVSVYCIHYCFRLS